MKNFALKVSLLSAIMASSNAWASCDELVCEGVTNTVISTMKASTAGTFLTFPAGTDAALDCALIDGSSALISQQHPQFKSIHSLMVTAVASNLSIKISFNTQQANCEVESAELKVAE